MGGADEFHGNHYDYEEWNDEETTEVAMGDGAIFLMRPTTPTNPRNAPGYQVSARRGAVQAFRNIANGK